MLCNWYFSARHVIEFSHARIDVHWYIDEHEQFRMNFILSEKTYNKLQRFGPSLARKGEIRVLSYSNSIVTASSYQSNLHRSIFGASLSSSEHFQSIFWASVPLSEHFQSIFEASVSSSEHFCGFSAIVRAFS